MPGNRLRASVVLLLALCGSAGAQQLQLGVRQLTRGPNHHFFGYIGQSLTTPWNASGRYILSLRTTFHDRMPNAGEAADVVLIDTEDNNRVRPIERSRAWNFQQGTMFYWHPRQPESQFFFNDRDPKTNFVYTVLYDLEGRRRLREYRFEDTSIANGGVSPTGEFFLAINYGRMARLRPVTGYPGAADPTAGVTAPADDGIFRIDIESGRRRLLVSFRELRDLLHDRYDAIDDVAFYINHTLINRTGQYVYFFARARDGRTSMAVNVPCSMRSDGSELTAHPYIGGHPEWDLGSIVIGAKEGRQVRYDVSRREIVGQIGTPELIPAPGDDITLSADANWFACGYTTPDRRRNKYVVLRRSDGAFGRSPAVSRGPFVRGSLRIDPAPRWNRDQTALLVPAMCDDGTRQLHLIEIKQ